MRAPPVNSWRGSLRLAGQALGSGTKRYAVSAAAFSSFAGLCSAHTVTGRQGRELWLRVELDEHFPDGPERGANGYCSAANLLRVYANKPWISSSIRLRLAEYCL